MIMDITLMFLRLRSIGPRPGKIIREIIYFLAVLYYFRLWKSSLIVYIFVYTTDVCNILVNSKIIELFFLV